MDGEFVADVRGRHGAVKRHDDCFRVACNADFYHAVAAGDLWALCRVRRGPDSDANCKRDTDRNADANADADANAGTDANADADSGSNARRVAGNDVV